MKIQIAYYVDRTGKICKALILKYTLFMTTSKIEVQAHFETELFLIFS